MDYENTTRISREDPYEEVWSQPMSILAKNHGISDVGLAKICKRFKIPLPRRGYWQRKRHGKTGFRVPLPTLKEFQETTIFIRKKRELPVGQEMVSEEQSRIDFEKMDKNKILVASGLYSAHPLTTQTQINLKKAECNRYGVLSCRRRKCLDISVGPNSMHRALRIMDALFKALEKRDFKVSVTSKDPKDPYSHCETSVEVLGETLEFGLVESIKRTERDLTEKEMKSWHYRSKEFEFHPTGNLSLIIKTYLPEGTRRKWSEGKKRRLEDCLNDFIAGLIRAAIVHRARRLEMERERKKRLEEERKRMEEERIREEEERRFQSLSNVLSHKSLYIMTKTADQVKDRHSERSEAISPPHPSLPLEGGGVGRG